MKKILFKLLLLVWIAWSLGAGCRLWGMDATQSLSVAIFSGSILATVFFWDFRLGFAFIGTAVLLITKTIDLEHVIEFSSLEVILFLVGMMVIIGLLKDAGVFSLIVRWILHFRNLTGRRFVLLISVVSFLLACSVDEVTSIIFMVAAILEICAYLEVSPVPFVIISVLATNIGSAATVLGNPIGILIASKSGLTFEDFITRAFPLAVVCLAVAVAIVMVWYRRSIRAIDVKIHGAWRSVLVSGPVLASSPRELRVSVGIFLATLVGISLHHRVEIACDLAPNTVLLVVPLIVAGCVMIWKHGHARKYIEKDVEWWTLLFFLLLFVKAGTLKYTGATLFLAEKLMAATAHSPGLLTCVILWTSTIGSSILDNVMLVAALIPVIQGLDVLSVNLGPLWWALLFGGCLGGNITLVGSTANIVALGIMEKEKNIRMTFLSWFGIGLTVGVATTLVAWAALAFLPYYQH